jgi:Rtr1/RPAP2 family
MNGVPTSKMPKQKPLNSRQKAVQQSMESRHKWTSLVLQKQELLFTGAIPRSTLQSVLQYLSPITYDEVTEERVAEGYCGYPLCSSPHKVKEGKFMIHKGSIVDAEAMKLFCCKHCRIASEYLKSQLDVDAVYVRTFKETAEFDMLEPRVKHVLKPREVTDQQEKDCALKPRETSDDPEKDWVKVASPRTVKKEIDFKRVPSPADLSNKMKAMKLESTDGPSKPTYIPSRTDYTNMDTLLKATTSSLYNLEIKPKDDVHMSSETLEAKPNEIEGYAPKSSRHKSKATVENKIEGYAPKSTRKKYVKFVDSVSYEPDVPMELDLNNLDDIEDENDTMNGKSAIYDDPLEEDDTLNDEAVDLADEYESSSQSSIELELSLFATVWTTIHGLATPTKLSAVDDVTINHLKARVFKIANKYSVEVDETSLDSKLRSFNYMRFSPGMTQAEELVLCVAIIRAYEFLILVLQGRRLKLTRLTGMRWVYYVIC